LHRFEWICTIIISATIIPADNFVKVQTTLSRRKQHKKTPAGKGGEEPAGEKEEMLQQNANMGQQIILSCHLLYVVIHFYLSHFRANRQINIF